MTEAMTDSTTVSVDRLLDLLAKGDLEVQGLLPWSSNYTFLVLASDDQLTIPAVYKPCAGERPLWDFSAASLCRREVAAYLLSERLGWPAVPPVVLREGPHGLGSVQFFVNGDHDAHFFRLRESGRFDEALQQICLFDTVVNNADRKAGHCLLGRDGQVWAIDHGLTLHAEPKLRTVIWEYAGRTIPGGWLADLVALEKELRPDRPLWEALSQLLTGREIRALESRLEQLIRSGRFPQRGPGRSVPYPLV